MYTPQSQQQAYWNATAPVTDFPALPGDMEVDIAVVGGGIVGLCTARFLKDQGLRVALLEAHRVGRQVTGQSTAKVTTQHSTHYQTLHQKFGLELTRHYTHAQQAGVQKLLQLVAEHRIDCDLQPQPAYVYTCEDDCIAKLEMEAEITSQLGLPADLTRDVDLPFPVKSAMRFENQYQFHPTRFAAGLARTLPGEGCHVFENTPAIDYEPTRVVTPAGVVTCRHVVMATHLPLGQVGLFYACAHPFAEPVIAARIDREIPGMYINVEEPSRSLRMHRSPQGQLYAIAAGNGFKPGHVDEEQKNFRELEDWLTTYFGAQPALYRWVNMDYRAIDHAPYVGWSSGEPGSYLVATGFNAWGISNGVAAGMILADLAAGKDNPWLELFDASRHKPLAGGPSFLKENAHVASHLVSGYLSKKPTSTDQLAAGEAAILKLDGQRIAAYRDDAGKVHAVSAVCSHMGCIVGWNHNDRTWDCPCHGSRFDLQGNVIHGPATAPLDGHITG